MVRTLPRVWLLGLGGCLWIGEAEHADRLAEVSPTDTGTDVDLPPFDLQLEPVDDRVGACSGEERLLEGSVDGAWASAGFAASLQVGDAPAVSVPLATTADGDRLTFELPLAYPEDLACSSDVCDQQVTLALTADDDPTATDQASVTVAFQPASEPVVDTLFVAAQAVTDGAEITADATSSLQIELTDPRLGPAADDIVIVACPADTGIDDPGCLDLVADGASEPEGATVEVVMSELHQASCGDDALQAVDLFAEVQQPCGDFELTLATGVSFPSDCDDDGSPYAEDCDDFDDQRSPSFAEVCDEVDRDCNDDPYDLVTYTVGGVSAQAGRDELQTALTSSDEGSTIELCGGTYVGTLTMPLDRHLVGGGGDPILDGGKLGTVLSITGPQAPPEDRGEASVQGVTIRGGSAVDGGGLYLEHVILTLTDVHVVDNAASGQGGGVWGEAVNLTMIDSSVTGNTARDGGGMHVMGATLDLQRTELYANEATADGGGLVGRDANVQLDDDSSIRDNDSGADGGGAFLSTNMNPTELAGGSVVGNTAGGNGGGLWVGTANPGGTVDPIAVDTVIEGNTAAAGGGVFIEEVEAEFAGGFGKTPNQVTGGPGGADARVGASGLLTLRCADPSPAAYANDDGEQLPLVEEPCQQLAETGAFTVVTPCTCSAPPSGR